METHLKLAAWIAGKGIRKSEAARLFGVKAPHLSRWLSGDQVPSLRAAFIIQTATDGEITMEMWVNE